MLEVAEEVCALCDRKATLQESHIVPAFVYKWLKQTSATGYLRFVEEPDKRVQDGLKAPLLCKACEGRCADWESETAKRIFLPLHRNGTLRCNYGPWLAKFAASVSWRGLLYMKRMGVLEALPAEAQPAMLEAMATWRSFLLDTRKDLGPFNQHMFQLTRVEAEDIEPDTPPNINVYAARAVDLDIAFGATDPQGVNLALGLGVYLFVKMCRLALVGTIVPAPLGFWVGTTVHVDSGEFGRPCHLSPGFTNYMFYRARKVMESQRQQSPRQRQAIEQAYQRDWKKTQQSGSFDAFDADVALFGDAAHYLDDDEQN